MDRSLVKRFRFTIGAVVVAVVGLLASQFWFNRTSEECKPVVDLLDFNRQQSELISAKAGDQPNAVPSQTEQLVYEQWADGLSARAGKVTDPKLAAQAVELAQAANDFVTRLPDVRAATDARAPGAPTPPVVYEISVLNDRINTQLADLSKACKR